MEPLDERNILVFGAGPLVGTVIPSNGRYNVSTRSPLTGLIGDANSAGFWALPLKLCGYDGLLVEGVAERPVYLHLEPGKCEFHDGDWLWGRTVSETEASLKTRHGEDTHILSIGPGGENLVRYACTMNGLGRAAGRTGCGAVMGSKKLKAIAIKARGSIATADPDAVREIAGEIRVSMKSSPSFKIRSRFGTPMHTTLYNAMGVLPTRNDQSGVFRGAREDQRGTVAR